MDKSIDSVMDCAKAYHAALFSMKVYGTAQHQLEVYKAFLELTNAHVEMVRVWNPRTNLTPKKP